MLNLMKRIIMLPQDIFQGVFNTQTGILGMVKDLKQNIAKHPILMIVYFTANTPLWLVWGIIMMRSLVRILSPLDVTIALNSNLLPILTFAILLSRGYIIYSVHSAAQGEPRKHSNPIKQVAFDAKQTVVYTLRYTREKLITAGLFLVLILALPLLITGSTLVFAAAILTVTIIWGVKRKSRVDLFYKGLIPEIVLIVMWLELINSFGMLHQSIVFLMIVLTTGVFALLRINKVQRILHTDATLNR